MACDWAASGKTGQSHSLQLACSARLPAAEPWRHFAATHGAWVVKAPVLDCALLALVEVTATHVTLHQGRGSGGLKRARSVGQACSRMSPCWQAGTAHTAHTVESQAAPIQQHVSDSAASRFKQAHPGAQVTHSYSGATLKVVQEALCAASGVTGPCPQQAAPGLDTLLRRPALPIGARCAVVLDVRASSAGAGDAHAALVDSARLARKDGDGAARQTGQGQAVRVLGALVRRQGSTAP